MASEEKLENLPNKIIANLSEIPLESLFEYKFDKNLFSCIFELEKLDRYLDLNFVSYAESNNKEKLKTLSKILVKSLGLLFRYYENTPEINKFIIKWEHLSKLCSYYIDARSYKSSYEEIRKNNKLIKIIIFLFKEKSCIFSDIVSYLQSTKQNIFPLVSKLENLGIVTKRHIGKNVFVSLTSIGLDIYFEYIKESKMENNNLESKISQLFPGEKLDNHKENPVLRLFA